MNSRTAMNILSGACWGLFSGLALIGLMQVWHWIWGAVVAACGR